MRRFAAIVVSLSLLSVCRAGLYDPASPPPFRFKDGVVLPLEFGAGNSGEFAVRFSNLLNLADPNPRRKNDDRASILKRIAAFKADDATSLQKAGHAVDLIHTGQPEQAIAILQPLSRGRSASFVVLMNLAHAYAVTGDWNAALRTHDIALDYDAAADLPNYPPDLRTWLIGIEKSYYRAWLRWNLNNPKPNPETQQPLPLFGDTKPPVDALAIVQQMLLWQPGDANLYWLLAERYISENQPRQALTIFNQLADSRQYSNRKVMMSTRAYVLDVVSKLPPDLPAEEIDITPATAPPGDWDDGLPPLRNILFAVAIFGPLAILLITFQILRLRKRIARP